MRLAPALIIAVLLPAAEVSAQARKDSARHQNNHMSPQSQQANRSPLSPNRGTQQWPQDQARTELFCDQYARAAAGMRGRVQGGQTGAQLGYGLGYIGTRDHYDALGAAAIAGAIGSSAGAAQDQQFYNFHFSECRNGGRLVTTPK